MGTYPFRLGVRFDGKDYSGGVTLESIRELLNKIGYDIVEKPKRWRVEGYNLAAPWDAPAVCDGFTSEEDARKAEQSFIDNGVFDSEAREDYGGRLDNGALYSPGTERLARVIEVED
jgi:hypothetical protein